MSLLHIESAQYGIYGHMMDVTKVIQDNIKNDFVRLLVSNASFANDPAPHSPKTLNVRYVYGKQPGEVDIPEGGTLRLPP